MATDHSVRCGRTLRQRVRPCHAAGQELWVRHLRDSWTVSLQVAGGTASQTRGSLRMAMSQNASWTSAVRHSASCLKAASASACHGVSEHPHELKKDTADPSDGLCSPRVQVHSLA